MDVNMWIFIKIGQTTSTPVKIDKDGRFSISNSLNTQSCTFNVDSKASKIPIDVIYMEGEIISIAKIIKQERICLLQEKGFVNKLSNILDILVGNSTRVIKLDLYFNQNENGANIGFLATRYKPMKYALNASNVNSSNKKSLILSDETAFDGVSQAKDIFILNCKSFAELLLLSSLGKKNNLTLEWKTKIKSLNDSEVLLTEFNKYSSDIDRWLRIIKSWGIKQDSCKKYFGSIINIEFYSNEECTRIEDTKCYIVTVPCWTIWVNVDGKSTEQLIAKGFVKEEK